MSGKEGYRWRLRQVTLAVGAVLTLVFGVGCWMLVRETGEIRKLATDNRLGDARAQAFDAVASQVEAMMAAGYGLTVLVVLATGLLAVKLLLRPILLTTTALEAGQISQSVSLPVSSVREIDLFYRGVERLAKALTEIEEANRQARAAQAELRRLASIDELTGVANRRWFTAMASRELERCRRFNHQLALLMLDIDHFKRVNDMHGHAVGDEVLKAFSRVIESNLRSIDLFGRLGGEEFAILLPETDGGAAQQTAERLRAAVEKMDLPLVDGAALKITTSLGIAILRSGGETLDSILARADRALYTAKHEGRNRAVTSAVED